MKKITYLFECFAEPNFSFAASKAAPIGVAPAAVSMFMILFNLLIFSWLSRLMNSLLAVTTFVPLLSYPLYHITEI